jgi:hypothetical protein
MIGFYSTNLERFLMIKDDRWISLIVGKLLSSKFSISLIEFDSDEITNSNCQYWSLKDPSMIFSDRQLPRLQLLDNQLINKKTYALDISYDLFLNYQKFSNFVYGVVLATRMTDAVLNSNDQNFILSLFDNVPLELKKTSDDVGLSSSFMNSIDKIIYFSTSIEEAQTKIKDFFENKTNMVSNFKNYKKTFYYYLSQYETNL